jgi:hypothetical protein
VRAGVPARVVARALFLLTGAGGDCTLRETLFGDVERFRNGTQRSDVMKQLINTVGTVAGALEGGAAAHPARSAGVGMRGFSRTVRAVAPHPTRRWDAPVDTTTVRWGR